MGNEPSSEGTFRPSTERDAKVVLIPVPFDATTSYRPGTHKGPSAILNASKQGRIHVRREPAGRWYRVDRDQCAFA